MELRLRNSLLRPLRESDAEALARHADDREVWRNLKDYFPHPYGLADAQAFIARARATAPLRTFAIEHGGELAGVAALALHEDVFRRNASLGYWLGRTHWNRGIMSEAVLAVTEYAFTRLDLVRVSALVYAWNPASMRVLEKCGFEREGVQRHGAFKDGRLVDCVLFAKLRG